MHGILVKLFWLVGGSMLDWRVGAANYTNLIEVKKTPPLRRGNRQAVSIIGTHGFNGPPVNGKPGRFKTG